MKLLVVGDFHGEFPRKFEKIIDKEKVDIVVSTGDYFPFYYRKLWFKHCYGTGKMLWEVIGKNKYKKLVLRDLKDGEYAIRKLNSVRVPVVTTYGNVDYVHDHSDVMDFGKMKKEHSWKWDWQDFFTKIVAKYRNINRCDYRYFKFQDYVFIGASGSSFPGVVNSGSYRKHKKILDNLFKKFRKENKQRKVIFVYHNQPHNTKLDKIGNKAHKAVRGKHGGSKLVRYVIDRYNPVLGLGGHIHETRGVQKLGRTLCVNPGAAHDGQGATLIISGRSTKVKLFR